MPNFPEEPTQYTFRNIVLISDSKKQLSDAEVRQIAHFSLELLNFNQKVEFHAEHDSHLAFNERTETLAG